LDKVKFWKDKYIVSGVTGELTNKRNFWNTVRYVLESLGNYKPREYYKENLSLMKAADFIKEKIHAIRI